MNQTLKKGTDRVRGKGDEEEGGGRVFPQSFRIREWGLIGPGPFLGGGDGEGGENVRFSCTIFQPPQFLCHMQFKANLAAHRYHFF